jgi:hypothetical protein
MTLTIWLERVAKTRPSAEPVDLTNEVVAMSKKHSPEEQQPVFAIGFYRREQWPRLLETAADRRELEDSYDGWKLNLKKSVKNMRALGMTPLKVDIDMEELLTWCAVRGLKHTGESRAEFIADLLRQSRGKKIEEQDLE